MASQESQKVDCRDKWQELYAKYAESVLKAS